MTVAGKRYNSRDLHGQYEQTFARPIADGCRRRDHFATALCGKAGVIPIDLYGTIGPRGRLLFMEIEPVSVSSPGAAFCISLGSQLDAWALASGKRVAAGKPERLPTRSDVLIFDGVAHSGWRILCRLLGRDLSS